MQVSGITEAGEGLPSEITEAETSVEKPIPQLLLANIDGVKVTDIDSHEERLVYNKAVHPAAVAYLAQERRVFWMEEGALMVSSMDGKNTSQVIFFFLLNEKKFPTLLSSYGIFFFNDIRFRTFVKSWCLLIHVPFVKFVTISL